MPDLDRTCRVHTGLDGVQKKIDVEFNVFLLAAGGPYPREKRAIAYRILHRRIFRQNRRW